ncbi:PREDICTED: protein FRIGIDA-ESSENTIAL 1-like isoform X1 [Camelina sativa]|uniref:Protein FRIGIDA-ESSENTIAL 1-like isoform X1 n=1 Tax=Camelina sativa TaxID=90675 RepID=A0ABM1Q844_CAMSA|nr:PREDICTED: protein FRIGIDA-ESSENTIAL 1-like isoform X1 [Camelina sativa]
MSDSDMDIDDDEVEQKVQVHTIGGESQLLHKPIQAPNPQNGNSFVHSNSSHVDVKRHSVTTPSNEQANIIKEQAFAQDNGTLSRFPAPGITPNSFFPAAGEGNEPEQKRAAHLCKFFAKGWCFNGVSCKFLHVKENSNCTSQQQPENNMAGSSYIQSDVERRISNSIRVSHLMENGVTPSHTREDLSFVNPPGSQRVFSSMSFVNPPGSQRVFPFNNEMRFLPSSENIGRESLQQTCGAAFTDNRSLVINNSNSFTLRSSFVHHEHRSPISSYLKPDIGSSGPAWTGSLSSSVASVPMNEGASTVANFKKEDNIYGSRSLPTLQESQAAVSSEKGAAGNTTSSRKKVSSDDWEPSEPFKASFTIPPYILPSSDALYDPFTDIENLGDRSRNASLSSKGEQARKNSRQQKDGDSGSGTQARECKNDDKSSSCSQNQHQESVARRSLEPHGVVEGVATSVVDQNDTATPSKEISSAAAAENRVVLKRSKPAGHDAWHRSDGSSYKKTLKSDEIDGEVRSDAEIKVMRQFRTAVVETVKEMLKPLWREGRLTKDVHNMIVKKAAEKVVSAAVQFHQVPTDTGSVDQYLGLSATKIVKLVEVSFLDRN